MENDDIMKNEIMSFLKDNLVSRDEIKQIVETSVNASEAQIMGFLKEHMVLREEANATFATKTDLQLTESRVLMTVDRFAKLHETLD